MHLQHLFPEELLIAHITYEVPLVKMCLLMPVHVSLVVKPLLAIQARVRFDPQMSANMPLQTLLRLELFITLWTDESLLVPIMSCFV